MENLRKNQIHISKDNLNEFTISVKEMSPIGKFALIVLFCIFFIIPLAIIGLMISNHEGPKFAFLIGILFHWGIAYYLFRLISWNQYGTEKYILEGHKLKRHSDFKFFKDHFHEIELNGVNFKIEDTGYIEDGMAFLIIENGKNVLTSDIKVHKTELQDFIGNNKTMPNTSYI